MAKKPGPKPGNPHSGQFRKGDDPRRHIGSPWAKQKQSFQELCKGFSLEAVQVLGQTVTDESASLKERIAAAELIIAHGFGRPVDRVQVAQIDGTTHQAPENYSLEDLRSWAAKQALEVEYTEVESV